MVKIKYNTDIISGALFSIVGAALWLLIPSQIRTMEKGAINAQTIPRIAIGGIFIFAVCLLLEGLFLRPKKEVLITKETFRSDAFRKEMRSAAYALFLIVYCFLISPLGFLPSTALLVVAILLFYGARKWYYFAIPLGMIGIVYYVFHTLLHVSLP